MMFRGDAEFVDIIHTNSGNLWEGCLSIPKVFFDRKLKDLIPFLSAATWTC